MLSHFQMFAAYNAWANRLVYRAAADLTDHELHADKGAFFGSVFATLTHILVADRIWLHRMTGQGETHTALNARPFEDLASLEAARTLLDQRIIDFTGGLTEDRLVADFSYVPITNPVAVSHKLQPVLSHIFNHQTHHRGQVHAILTALGKPSVSLDMIYFIRTDGKAWA